LAGSDTPHDSASVWPLAAVGHDAARTKDKHAAHADRSVHVAIVDDALHNAGVAGPSTDDPTPTVYVSVVVVVGVDPALEKIHVMNTKKVLHAAATHRVWATMVPVDPQTVGWRQSERCEVVE